MFNRTKNLIHRFIERGTPDSLNTIDRIRVQSLNTLIFVGYLVLPILMIYNLANQLYYSLVIDVILLGLFHGVHKLAARGKVLLASIGFVSMVNFFTFVVVFLEGVLPYYSLLFLAFVGIPTVLIPSKAIWAKRVLIALAIMAYVTTAFIMPTNRGMEADAILISKILFSSLSIFILVMGFNFWEDLTIRSQKELIENQTRLISSNQLSNIGIMSAGIAHEINNPLAIIKGSASLLSAEIEDLPKDKKAKLEKLIGRQVKAVERTVKIVESIRFLSRDGVKDEFKPESINDILNDTLDLAFGRAKDLGIPIEFESLLDPPTINCQKVQIGQILLNLLGNSFDAIQDQDDPWVRVDVDVISDYILIRVTDSGHGIKAEVLDKIMMPFFTTKPVGQGTGVGLSLSKKIAHLHGGDLFYDETKANTSFVLKLPRYKSDAIAS